MKLKDLLESGDFSAYKFRTEYVSFHNYYDTFAELIYPDSSISWEHYEAVEKSGRVKQIALREWYCTDQHVGLYLYFVDDVPVCTMYQSGRKDYPSWEFVSMEAWQKVKDLFDSCRPEDEFDETRVPIMDELLRLDLSENRKEYSISNMDLGYSPIKTVFSVDWLENFETRLNSMKEDHKEKYLKGMEEVFDNYIDAHEAFMSSRQTQEEFDFAYDTCNEIYMKAVEMRDRMYSKWQDTKIRNF